MFGLEDEVEYEDGFRVKEICGIRVGWENGFKFGWGYNCRIRRVKDGLKDIDNFKNKDILTISREG